MTAIRLCPSGKFAYKDKRDARIALRFWGSRPLALHQGKAGPVRLYRCPRPPEGCGMWHLTSKRAA